METLLKTILKNQEILNKNQIIIYNLLARIENKIPTEGREFVRNYLADLAGTFTTESGLIDISNCLK